jgi:D-alanyl-lipoteichoic acid acyltransferase DltB (MBOAT superfamily)
MLFNSYEFIFAFLPLTLLAFLLLGRASRELALGSLIVASLVFYAWWRPANLPIISVSLAINYVIARQLQRMARSDGPARLRTLLLAAGLVFNICFLGYFKYTDFLLGAANDIAGTQFVMRHIILPLGMSFITFQKIAFLLDVHAGRVEDFRLRDYLLFVLFFPQLVAGPIVHYREMMPQFHRASCRFEREGFVVGTTLFCFGLFKKVVLADSIAYHVSPVYLAAAQGQHVTLIAGWLAAVGFALQLYFDFSGYSEMAGGLARMFGVRLPLNFYSPFQASSIIDFWSRWHVTLTRFLTAYLYNPLLLWLTRRRYARGLPGMSGHRTSVGAFLQLLAFPTLITMLVSGLWHGAGYLFLLWGLLHGVYLVINHGWRMLAARRWPDRKAYARVMTPVGFVITLLSVMFAMVLFRAPTLAAAGEVFRGMLGLHGIALPPAIANKLLSLGAPQGLISVANMASKDFVIELGWLFGLLGIALLLPNTLQLMSQYDPMLGTKERAANTGIVLRALRWNPTLPWAVVLMVLTAIAIQRVGGPSEFLYWQF